MNWKMKSFPGSRRLGCAARKDGPGADVSIVTWRVTGREALWQIAVPVALAIGLIAIALTSVSA
jgi:hypothetical protein